MHEMSIAENILEIINQTLKDRTHARLLSATVEVGELTAVIPESLQFCFESLIESTAYKGAKLKIKDIPLQGICKHCEESFKINDYHFVCPACRSWEIQVTGGQELNVTELEVE